MVSSSYYCYAFSYLYLQPLLSMKAVWTLLFLLATTTTTTQSHNAQQLPSLTARVVRVCDGLLEEVHQLTSQTKQLTNQLNMAITAGQVNVKDAFKPKTKQVLALTQQIQAVTKITQMVYNHKKYIKFCLLLQEESKYGVISQEQYLIAIEELNLLKETLQKRRSTDKDQL